MTALYQISNDFLEVIQKGIGEDGEILPGFAEALDKLEVEFDTKVESIVQFVKNLDAEAATFEAEAERLRKHAAAQNKKSAWLKGYLKQQLERLGRKSAGVPLHTVIVRKNSNPRVSILDSLRPFSITPELLKSLSDAGLKQIESGWWQGAIGPWRVEMRLSTSNLQPTDPEYQHVRFEHGTHLRVK